jgi:hypothetical protein
MRLPLMQERAVQLAAHEHTSRNVRGDDRVAAQVPVGPAPEGQQDFDFLEAVEGVRSDYPVSGGGTTLALRRSHDMIQIKRRSHHM